MSLFKSYTETSGQFLSMNKCRFYVGTVSNGRRTVISNVLGFTEGCLPFNYLGVPLFLGKPRLIQF